MDAIEKRARELLAEALRQKNETRLAGMAEIPQGLDQIATHIALDAIIAALTPPEGWVLAPVEPTRGMVVAGVALAYDGKCASVYAAMLAARPEGKP